MGKKVLDYIIALTNLYGFVPRELVVDIYNMHHAKPITLDTIEEIYQNLPTELERQYIEPYRGCFVHETIMEFHEFDYYAREKSNKPYYIPEAKELLRYRDRCYFERTPYYDELVRYIAQTFYRGDEGKAAMLAEDIQGYCEMNEGDRGFSDLLSRRGLHFQQQGCKDCLRALVRKLCANTRTWNNNGFTQQELEQIISGEKVL